MNNKSWILNVEEDTETGDAILNLPPELLETVGWVEGDVLDWQDNKNGSWSLTKKLVNSIELIIKPEIEMNDRLREVMDISQEECAEVIQAISKIRRFGLNNHKSGESQTNLEHLEEELGDMLAMIDILVEMKVIDTSALNAAKSAKIEKLKKWSKIYE